MMEKELYALLTAQNFEEAADLVAKKTPEEIAALINELASSDEALLIPFCRAMESDALADALILLDKTVQKKILGGLYDDELEAVMDEVSLDDTVDIIEDMPEELVRRIAELDDILVLLKDRNYAVLKPLLGSMNAIDLAEVFEETENDTDLLILFRILPKDLAAEVFVEMDTDVTQRLINKLSDRELRAVMDELFLDDTVDLIEEMPASVVKRVLAQSDSETRAYINELLKYPKDSAGSIMTIEFVSLRPNMTVDIPRYFTLYNDYQKRPVKKKWTLEVGYYERLIMTFGKASDCIGCGSCESVCPQHLNIIENLKEIASRFEE